MSSTNSAEIIEVIDLDNKQNSLTESEIETNCVKSDELSLENICQQDEITIETFLNDTIMEVFFRDFKDQHIFKENQCVHILSPSTWRVLDKLSSGNSDTDFHQLLRKAAAQLPRIDFQKENHVVCPTLVDEDHWIFLVASVKNFSLKVTLLNSCESKKPSLSYLRNARVLSVLINSVFQSDYNRHGTLLKKKSFEIFLPKMSTPQQVETNNTCGAYVCYYMAHFCVDPSAFLKPQRINFKYWQIKRAPMEFKEKSYFLPYAKEMTPAKQDSLILRALWAYFNFRLEKGNKIFRADLLTKRQKLCKRDIESDLMEIQTLGMSFRTVQERRLLKKSLYFHPYISDGNCKICGFPKKNTKFHQKNGLCMFLVHEIYKTCTYPLCAKNGHVIRACPALHERCFLGCSMRGHRIGHHVDFSLKDLKYIFNAFKDQGVYTRKSEKFSQWGFYSDDFYLSM